MRVLDWKSLQREIGNSFEVLDIMTDMEPELVMYSGVVARQFLSAYAHMLKKSDSDGLTILDIITICSMIYILGMLDAKAEWYNTFVDEANFGLLFQSASLERDIRYDDELDKE